MNRPVSQSSFDLCDEDLDFLWLPILDSNQQAEKCGLQELLEVYPEDTANLFLESGQNCPFSISESITIFLSLAHGPIGTFRTS